MATSTLLSGVKSVSDYGNFILSLEQLFGLTEKGNLTGLQLSIPSLQGGTAAIGKSPTTVGFPAAFSATTAAANAWLPVEAGKLQLSVTVERLSDKTFFTGSVADALSYVGV